MGSRLFRRVGSLARLQRLSTQPQQAAWPPVVQGAGLLSRRQALGRRSGRSHAPHPLSPAIEQLALPAGGALAGAVGRCFQALCACNSEMGIIVPEPMRSSRPARQRADHASLLARLSATVTAFCTDLAQADFRRVDGTLLDHGLAFDSHPILVRRFEPLALFT